MGKQKIYKTLGILSCFLAVIGGCIHILALLGIYIRQAWMIFLPIMTLYLPAVLIAPGGSKAAWEWNRNFSKRDNQISLTLILYMIFLAIWLGRTGDLGSNASDPGAIKLISIFSVLFSLMAYSVFRYKVMKIKGKIV